MIQGNTLNVCQKLMTPFLKILYLSLSITLAFDNVQVCCEMIDPPPPPPPFVADRPFMFYFQHHDYRRAVLFMGKINFIENKN